MLPKFVLPIVFASGLVIGLPEATANNQTEPARKVTTTTTTSTTTTTTTTTTAAPVTTRPKPPATTAATIPPIPADLTGNRALGAQMMSVFFGDEEWPCLETLWTKESGWNQYADNPTSDAYGIPQALPGSKMASKGADWQTNPATQIAWGLEYIITRYGTPCQALAAHRSKGWY